VMGVPFLLDAAEWHMPGANRIQIFEPTLLGCKTWTLLGTGRGQSVPIEPSYERGFRVFAT
jgi:hypothetical protein